MGMQIESGTGKGYTAGVDNQNRILSFTTSESLDHHINVASGKVWSIPWENIANTGADDYIIYIKNTGSKDLYFEDIRISCSAATQIEIHHVTGTAGGSLSNITPVSRNLGSSSSPSATIQSSSDVTGLTNAGVLAFKQCPVADTDYELRIPGDIIIPKGKAIAVLVETTSITTTGFITLVEAE
jgi:hypothetical protein